MIVTDQVIQHNHRAKLQDTTPSQRQNPGYNSHRAILQDTTVTEPKPRIQQSQSQNPGHNSHRAKLQDTTQSQSQTPGYNSHRAKLQDTTQSQSQTPGYNTVTEPNSRWNDYHHQLHRIPCQNSWLYLVHYYTCYVAL